MSNRRTDLVLAVVVAAAVLVAGCSQTSSSSTSSAGPAGVVHTSHLRGGVYASGDACSDCHAPTGFAVDFSQNPMVQVHGGAFDPKTQTCSNVYCHGAFKFGPVSGAYASVSWTNPTPLTCSSCHGMPPAGHPAIGANADAKSCSGCHADSVNPDGTINVAKGAHMNGQAEAASGGCATCHGDATRTGNLPGTDFYLTSAPPVSTQNASPSSVGAHQAHMNPTTTSAMAAPVACAECHVVPADSAHATNPPAQPVAFGPLASTGGASPAWNPTTLGCAATYCHGNFTLLGVSGASATPLWTDGPMTCTSCHGMPPTGHPPLPAGATAASCSTCHPQSITPQGTVDLVTRAHGDGKAQTAALGCTACHGDANRTANLAGTDVNLASSPPIATATAKPYAVGAHLGHVNPTAASYLMPPIACSECHPVPTDSTHANNPPPQIVVFGPLSKMDGAQPAWNATTAGCAASYCHGNFTLGAVSGNLTAVPLWTDGPVTCVSCHGMIPTGHPAYTTTAGYTAATCAQCHPTSVNADGTIKQGGTHMNGKADGGDCKSCHGDPPTTGGHNRHSNYGCGECHTGYTSTVANTALHQNGVVNLGPSQVGYLCNGQPSTVGCTPLPPPPQQPVGPYGTCTNNCHEKHTNRTWTNGN